MRIVNMRATAGCRARGLVQARLNELARIHIESVITSVPADDIVVKLADTDKAYYLEVKDHREPAEDFALASGAVWTNEDDGGQPISGATILNMLAALLPPGSAARYSEEWRGELYDMRSERAPWYHRAAHILSIVGNVPKLAVEQWLHARRAVE